MVVHQALDGSRFRLDGALPLDGVATSTADVRTVAGMHQLHAGPVGLGADVAGAAGVGPFAEEFSYEGGTLRIARRKLYDARAQLSDDLLVACWTRARHSLVLHLYNSSTERVLGVLRTLVIDERPDGVVARPTATGGTTFRGPSAVLKQVPGLGLLEIRSMSAELARELPSWAGVRVAGGELFRDTLPGGGTYFLLATRRVRVTVLPLADTVVDDVPRVLEGLRVDRLA